MQRLIRTVRYSVSQVRVQNCAKRAFSSFETSITDIDAVDDIPSGWKGVKRFYDSTGVRPVNAQLQGCSNSEAKYWQVLLDDRVIRTNGMQDLLCPSEGLALAIAAEFAAQRDMIHPPSTPLYNLICTAIDQYVRDDTSERRSIEYGHQREDDVLALRMGECLETDTVCYRVDSSSGDPADALLRRRQDKYYDPLVQWFEQEVGGPLAIAEGLDEAKHPIEVFRTVENIVYESDYYVRAALYHLVGVLKSTVISTAFVYRHISVQQAFDASRVEEEHQIEENGFVEDGHDTTRAHTLVKLTSISNFLWLLPESRLPDLAVVRQQHSSKRRHREVSRQSLMEELVGSERAASMGSGAGFAPRPGRRSVGDMLLENMDNVEKAVEGTGKQPKVTDYMVSGVSDARHLVSEQRLMAELEEELAASERAQTIEGSTVPSTEDESKSGKQ